MAYAILLTPNTDISNFKKWEEEEGKGSKQVWPECNLVFQL